MLSSSSEHQNDSPPQAPLPHSRVGIAAFVSSTLSVLTSGHLMPLLAAGVRLSDGYLIACQWTSAALAGLGLVLAMIALFDIRRNRFFGMLGWWLSIIGLSTMLMSICMAVRHHLLRS